MVLEQLLRFSTRQSKMTASILGIEFTALLLSEFGLLAFQAILFNRMKPGAEPGNADLVFLCVRTQKWMYSAWLLLWVLHFSIGIDLGWMSVPLVVALLGLKFATALLLASNSRFKP